MATEILRPNGDCYSTLVAWDASAGNDYQCVDEAVANDDTDYVHCTTTSGEKFELFAMENTSDASGETINSVTNWFRGKYETAQSQIEHLCRSGAFGMGYPGDTETMTSSYANYDYEWATNPADDEAWASTDIDAFCFGFVAPVQQAGGCRVTQHYIVVDYGAAAGSSVVPIAMQQMNQFNGGQAVL